jgi:hypothetical protein
MGSGLSFRTSLSRSIWLLAATAMLSGCVAMERPELTAATIKASQPVGAGVGARSYADVARPRAAPIDSDDYAVLAL